jgi:hypothetical protein
VARAEALHRRQPGLIDELEKARRRRGRGVCSRKPKSTPVWAAARWIAPSTPFPTEIAATDMAARLDGYG